MKKWLLIVGAGLLVVGATILLTPVGGAATATLVGEVAVVGGGGAVMASFVEDHRMSEAEIDEVFATAQRPETDPTQQSSADTKPGVVVPQGMVLVDSEQLAQVLSSALASNDVVVRREAREALVELAERDPEAALGAIEVGLASHRNEVRRAAGEALILATEGLEDPSQAHSLVVRAIRSPYYQLRRQGGDALRVFARRASETQQVEQAQQPARGGLIDQLSDTQQIAATPRD